MVLIFFCLFVSIVRRGLFYAAAAAAVQYLWWVFAIRRHQTRRRERGYYLMLASNKSISRQRERERERENLCFDSFIHSFQLIEATNAMHIVSLSRLLITFFSSSSSSSANSRQTSIGLRAHLIFSCCCCCCYSRALPPSGRMLSTFSLPHLDPYRYASHGLFSSSSSSPFFIFALFFLSFTS